MEINININDIICETFIDLFDDIVNHKVNRAVLKGGRSSTKSQFNGIVIVSSCMINKESAICLLKYNNRIEKRLCKLIKKSIRLLGVQKFWKFRKSKLEYVMLEDDGTGKMVETDVVICFAGCDNPDDLKSFTEDKNFSYVWFEELATFKSLADVKNLIATFARGGDSTILMSYNPPISNSNWCNKEYNAPIGKALGHTSNYLYTEEEFEIEEGVFETARQVIHHSTWLDVPAKWLGRTFIAEARHMEKTNPKMYRWMYLGSVEGTEANVFENIVNWDGDTSELDIKEIFRGLDHGYGGKDPTAYVEWYYDRRNKCIYALNEFEKSKMSLDDIAYEIKQYNKFNFPVYADSASPILNNELVNKGVNIEGAIKGPDSIRAGIKWLTSLEGIYICASRTPNIYKEFTEYEYIIDKNENVTSKLVEGAEHTCDATRYAFGLEIKYI